MMSLVIVIGLIAACSANPTLYYYGGAPQYFYGGYYPSAPAVGPPAAVAATVKSQYHAQNEHGQYAYGYNDGYSSKSETKHANGLTEGSYSYVDPNGVLQQYKYESDENGYRVSGTNLPVAPAAPAPAAVPAVPAPAVAAADVPQQVQDTPEVAAAKVAHRIAYDEAKQAADASPDDGSYDDGEVPAAPVAPVAPVAPAATVAVAPVRSSLYGYSAYGVYPSYAYAAAAPVPPVAAYAAYAAPAPYGAVHGQYHTQDEYGQYAYGYDSGLSSKAETKTLDGVTRGGYSYVDANGLVQQYHYVSDPVNGFRVAGTNLPSSNHL